MKYLFKFDRYLFKFFSSYKLLRRIFFALMIRFFSIRNKQDLTKKEFKNKKILFASVIGGNSTIMGFENYISQEFEKRGAETKVILCDGILPACFECTYLNKPKVTSFVPNQISNFCNGCFISGRVNTKLEKIFRLSSFIQSAEHQKILEIASKLTKEQMENYCSDGINIGEHAKAGALRFLSTSVISHSEYDLSVLRQYFISSEITRISVEKILLQYSPDLVFLIHGLYSPHGIISEVCKKLSVRQIVWNLSYRKGTFITSPKETYHRSLITEDPKLWLEMPLDQSKEIKILSYLKSRENGKADWVTFNYSNKKEVIKTSNFLKSINQLKGEKRIVTLLTNVSWDAQIHYQQNIFQSMQEWIFETIEWFIDHPNIILIIRIHPAEITSKYPTKEKLIKTIFEKYPGLPKNIVLIDSSNQINTYSVCKASDNIIIYGTKMGVELAPLGKSIIVAGEAWIKNKGLTHDPKSKNQYFDLLEQIETLSLPASYTYENSIKYAYHFFFEIMQDFPGVRNFIDTGCIVNSNKDVNQEELNEVLNNFLNYE